MIVLCTTLMFFHAQYVVAYICVRSDVQHFVSIFVLQLATPDQSRDLTHEELEDKWDDISGELSSLIQGRGELPTDVAPFDAASEVDIDHQRYTIEFKTCILVMLQRHFRRVLCSRNCGIVWFIFCKLYIWQ